MRTDTKYLLSKEQREQKHIWWELADLDNASDRYNKYVKYRLSGKGKPKYIDDYAEARAGLIRLEQPIDIRLANSKGVPRRTGLFG